MMYFGFLLKTLLIHEKLLSFATYNKHRKKDEASFGNFLLCVLREQKLLLTISNLFKVSK